MSLVLAASIPCLSATTNVRFYNSAGFELKDFESIPLFKGDSGFSNGDIIQIGYYTMATTSNPFVGEWTPLISRTIGGKLEGSTEPGRYSYLADLSPAEILLGVPLALRFYDSPKLSSSKFYNAISDVTGAWNMINSPDGPVTMTLSLSDSTLIWQDGSASSFRTTIPVPEPSGLLLSAATLLHFLKRRVREQQ